MPIRYPRSENYRNSTLSQLGLLPYLRKGEKPMLKPPQLKLIKSMLEINEIIDAQIEMLGIFPRILSRSRSSLDTLAQKPFFLESHQKILPRTYHTQT